MTAASRPWVALPYEAWQPTCDTLHAHTQVLGKLAVALAPPEPQLQHAALRLTARGWETLPLPAPDGSGVFVVALDLQSHDAVVEHSDGRALRVPLAPDRAVAEVTHELLSAVNDLAGAVHIDPRPQETPWTTPLDEDYEHATYNPAQVTDYFAAATQAALVLAALRAPVPRAFLAGERVVGKLRSRGQPVLGTPGRATVERLHHAQLRQRPADRGRLVARRRPPRERRVRRISRFPHPTGSGKRR